MLWGVWGGGGGGGDWKRGGRGGSVFFFCSFVLFCLVLFLPVVFCSSFVLAFVCTHACVSVCVCACSAKEIVWISDYVKNCSGCLIFRSSSGKYNTKFLTIASEITCYKCRIQKV